MATVFSGLVSKLVVTVSPDLASKIGGFGFPDLGLKNRQLQFGDLGLKITVMISCFGPENQAGYGLSVAPQN
jgi:hypothetical protein